VSWHYNRKLDRMCGHGGPGLSAGFVRWEQDEIELGARVAMALDDPEQWWWELIGHPALEKAEKEERGL
jgi:hypothetical protein